MVQSAFPLVSILASLALSPPSCLAQQPNSDNPPPKIAAPLAFGTVHSQRVGNGVPLGGIGCGTFHLLTDGTVSRAATNNNWSHPTGDLNGCFAAVWTNAGGRLVSRALTLKSPYGLPSAAAVDFRGLFPQAFVQYPEPALPVSVSLRAFSPLVPQDLMSSTIPAALFVFTIRNEARAPVDASVALSWENLIGVGGTAAKGAFADRTGNVVMAYPPAEGIFGVRMTGPARPPTDPATRLYYNAQGDIALMAQPTTPDTIVTTAGWNALDKNPGWWEGFERDGTVAGTVAAGREGANHPAGVVALRVSLKAGESRELPFVVAWHTPRLYTLDGMEYGHFYQKMFANAPSVARFTLQNRLAFAALTDEWQQRILRSSLPPWLAYRLINDASILFTNTLYTRDSGLAGTSAGPSLFAFLDQPQASSDLGAMDQRLYAHALLAALFPRLDLEEMEQFVSIQHSSGAIPRTEGSADEAIAPARSVTEGSQEGLVGSSASFAYQVAQYYFWTADPRFRDRFYPAAKHALEFAASRALSLAVAAAPSESDLALLRGALAAGERLAASIDDRRFAQQCREWSAAMKAPSAPELVLLEQWMKTSVSAAPPPAAPTPSPAAPAASPNAALQAALLTLAGRTDDALNLLSMTAPQSTSAEPPPTLATAASWYLLQAIAGPGFDPTTGRLSITPNVPRAARSCRVPLFSPTYWATIEFRSGPSRLQLQFTLERSLPVASGYEPPRPDGTKSAPPRTGPAASLLVKQVILPAPQNPGLQLSASVNRSPVTGKLAPGGAGRVVFTPDAPIVLATGQRLEFLFRP